MLCNQTLIFAIVFSGAGPWQLWGKNRFAGIKEPYLRAWAFEKVERKQGLNKFYLKVTAVESGCNQNRTFYDHYIIDGTNNWCGKSERRGWQNHNGN
jgi:hypothetical protein